MATKTVFLHVMKTGGTTFRSILSSIYGSQFHVCTNSALDNVERDLASFDCLELHLSNSPRGWVHHHSELAEQRRWDLLEGRNIFTMFRNPVDQILSNYFSMQRLRTQIEPRMAAIGVKFPETIEQYLDHKANFNNQTAFILGKSQKPGDYLDRNDLDEAITVLDRLQVHIGLTERFAESLAVFESVTGLTAPAYETRNQTSGRPTLHDVSPNIRQRIADQSQLDLELYAFAKSRFSNDLAAAPYTDASALSRNGASLVSSSPSR